MAIKQDQQQQRCAEQVIGPAPWDAFHPTQCKRKGAVEENGQWWCKQHSPSAKRARGEASNAKFREERRVRRAAEVRDTAVRAACEGVDTADLRPGMVSYLQHRIDVLENRLEEGRLERIQDQGRSLQ